MRLKKPPHDAPEPLEPVDPLEPVEGAVVVAARWVVVAA